MKVVIIGGGGFGSAAAYFLASHPRFAGTITVIERDPSYRHASSALSASGIRQQFSTALNIDLSLYGVEFMRHAAATLAVDGDAPLLPLREAGYLFLASPAGVKVLRQNHAVQQARGAHIVLLDPAALAARFPWLATEEDNFEDHIWPVLAGRVPAEIVARQIALFRRADAAYGEGVARALGLG